MPDGNHADRLTVSESTHLQWKGIFKDRMHEIKSKISINRNLCNQFWSGTLTSNSIKQVIIPKRRISFFSLVNLYYTNSIIIICWLDNKKVVEICFLSCYISTYTFLIICVISLNCALWLTKPKILLFCPLWKMSTWLLIERLKQKRQEKEKADLEEANMIQGKELKN